MVKIVLAGVVGVAKGLKEKLEAGVDGMAGAGTDPGFTELQDGQLVLTASLMQKHPGHSHESDLGLN